MRDVLNDALHEIESLRRNNQILIAQVGVVEVFAAALGMKRIEGGMASPDIVWTLRHKIDELDRQAQTKVER